jgi:hypothetical protein
MLRVFLWATFLSFVSCTIASAVDLNAPLKQQPTLGSEIHRGMSAGQHCNFIDDNNFNANGLDACISKAESKNSENNPNYKPFALGLRFEAWFWEDIHVTMTTKLHDKYTRLLANESKKFAPLDWEIVRSYQRDLGVTDDQLLQIAEIPTAGIKETKDRFAYWDAQLKLIGRLPH